MARYDYSCKEGCIFEVTRSMQDPEPAAVICPKHGRPGEWVPALFRATFKPTPGRDSGIYALDYGIRATEDLTVRGKLDRLRRDGKIGDPFADFDDEIKEGKREPYVGPEVTL